MFKSAVSNAATCAAMLAASGLMLAAPPATPAAGATAKLLKSIPLGATGNYDYICADADARRLYIPRGTHVQVMDLDKGTLLGDVPGSAGAHGVALALEQNIGFVTNGTPSTVSAFDLKTFKVIKTIKTVVGPDAIVFDPASKHILAMGHKSGDVSVIDPANLDKDPTTITIGGALEFAVADGQGHVFVNVEDKSEIVELDSKANRVLAHWSTAPGEGPTGLAIDIEHHRLFAGCDGNAKCVIFDYETGKQLAAVAAGAGIDGCAFDPTIGAMVANGKDGTLTIVKETSPGKFDTQTVKTLLKCRTITVDSKTHHALMPTSNVPAASGGAPAFGIAVVGAE